MAVLVNKSRHLIHLAPPSAMSQKIVGVTTRPSTMLTPHVPVAVDDCLLQNAGVQRWRR